MKKRVLSALTLLALGPLLSSCGDSQTPSDVIELSICNSDDYILTYDTDDGLSRTLIDDFIEKVKEEDGVTLKVSYSVFSTAEEILSKATAGTASYDLVCNSDYIIQKMLSLNMLEPFSKGEERLRLYGLYGHPQARDSYWYTDYYDKYASPTLKSLLGGITATVAGEERSLGDYSRGYMWGTLGITYNPGFDEYASRGISEDEVKADMSRDWNALWDEKYKGTFQIKDSMRDTYAVGIMHVYDRYFKELRLRFMNKSETGKTITSDEYQEDIKIIFNNLNYLAEFNALAKELYPNAPTYTKENILAEVKDALKALKDNSFGLEVDSGKTDITTGSKSGIDVAWSGDAITSMDLGDESTANPVSLYYSVPETGGNLWSDNWVMLKDNVHGDGKKKEYCQKFIDYLSDPVNARENMDYIGYTSFIGGDGLLEYVRESYDPRTAAMYVYDEENEGYLEDENGDYVHKDGTGVHDDGLDYGDVDMTGSNYAAACVDGVTMYWQEYGEKYGDSWVQTDLTYFFDGTLEDYSVDQGDTIFYSDEIEEVEWDGETHYVGRQFLAQYPVEDIAKKGTALCAMPSLGVMEDYGDSSNDVLSLWEEVKSSPLPVWAIVILAVEAAVALGAGGAFLATKLASRALRKKRRSAIKALEIDSNKPVNR